MKKSFKVLFILGITVLGVIGFALITESKILSSYTSSNKEPNNGEFKEYYDDGSLYSIEYYENGSKEGVWRYYYKNGKLKTRQSYSNDKINGTIYHFSKEGILIYNEVYRNDTLIDKLVANDSLYNYEVIFEKHGREMFNKTCIPCHNMPIEKNLRLSLNGLESFVDTVQITKISIDSIHTLYADSLEFQVQSEKVEVGPKLNFELDKYDLEAIMEYIEQEQIRSKARKRNRIRKVRERKKVVYLDRIIRDPFIPKYIRKA